AATDEALEMLKDSTGQYLEPPMSLNGMQKIVSNQLAYDEEKGSDALVFDPTAMVIGLQNNLVIKVIEDGECLKKGLVGFQIYSMLDCKAVRPKAICRVVGLK
ncbi:MAG: phage major capsid protein, partial [Blautia sp.]|nr:phage major capsid protein [Blautia sp.]